MGKRTKRCLCCLAALLVCLSACGREPDQREAEAESPVPNIRLESGGRRYELVQTGLWEEEPDGGWETVLLVSEESAEGPALQESHKIAGRVSRDADGSLLLADVDFDGRDDVLVLLGHFGIPMVEYYACFLSRDGGLEEDESFREIANPRVDPDGRCILSSWFGGSTHGWAEYTYQNGGFEMTRRLTQEPVPDEWRFTSAKRWQYTVETRLDGAWKVEEVWVLSDHTEEETNDRFHNESSDWGLYTDRWS